MLDDNHLVSLPPAVGHEHVPDAIRSRLSKDERRFDCCPTSKAGCAAACGDDGVAHWAPVTGGGVSADTCCACNGDERAFR
jgi:hypothetical protein